jgi:capsular polysaccharide biosynthesis protein
MELKEIGGALWRHRLLAIVVFAVTIGTAAAGLWLAPRTYTATATVAAAEDPANAVATESPDALRGTLAEIADDRDLVDEVRTRLSVERTTEELRRSIGGQWIEGTILVQLTVTDRDPDVAAEIANLLAETLPLYDPSGGSFLFTTTNRAVPPRSFSSPDPVLTAGAAVALGLILAAAATLIRDRRTTTVDEPADAEAAVQAPVLARVSRPHDVTSLPALYPGTEAADTFRRLRIALEAEASREPVHRLVVAGTSGDDDASVWLGANLAVSLAVAGRQVLLVDGRLGTRHGRPIATAPGAAGLYDVLTGADLDDGLSAGPVEGLQVLPSGDWGGESTERLLETRFAAVMDAATRRFDVVVVLAPAVDVCDDARVMAAGGSVVLTVAAGAQSPHHLGRVVSRVRSVGVRVLGTVLLTKHQARTSRAARAAGAAA